MSRGFVLLLVTPNFIVIVHARDVKFLQSLSEACTRGGGFDNITNYANAALANGVIDPTTRARLSSTPTGAPSPVASDI